MRKETGLNLCIFQAQKCPRGQHVHGGYISCHKFSQNLVRYIIFGIPTKCEQKINKKVVIFPKK